MRPSSKIATAILIASLTSACAASTSYKQERGDGGYDDLQASQYVHRISVSGNESTSQQQVQELALLRASELTLRSGRQRFVVLDENVARNSEVVSGGQTSVSNGGWFGSDNTTTVNVPNISTIVKSGGTMVIEAIASDDPRFGSAYDAALIDRQLRPKLVKAWWDPTQLFE